MGMASESSKREHLELVLTAYQVVTSDTFVLTDSETPDLVGCDTP